MKFKIFLGVAVGVMAVLPFVALGAYNDVNLSSGTTIRTTVGGATVDLTVTSGTVQSVTVESGSMDITFAAGSSLDITSAEKRNFTYRLNGVIASFECGSSSSVLNLSLSPGQSAETVTITPQSTTCVAVGSGGSSSGSSSSSSTSSTQTTTTSTTSTTSATPSATTSSTSATPSTTSTTATVVAVAPAVVAVIPTTVTVAPVVVSVPVAVLFTELDPGVRSDEVMTLQTLLASDPTIYPEGTVSGFYGPKTTAAVKNFQAKYGLPTVGRVGPATLEKINEVYGGTSSVSAPSTQAQTQTVDQIQSQIESIQQQIQALTGGAAGTSAVFGSGLGKGDSSSDVQRLQQLLNSDPDTRIAVSGVGSPGNETTLFGSLTEKAVQKFQVKYGIAGPGDAGYGYVGPRTRAKLQEVFGGSPSSTVAPQSPVTSITGESAVTASAADMIKQIEDQIKAIQDQINSLLSQ